MSAKPVTPANPEIPQTLSLFELFALLLAVAGGAFAATIVLPAWLPGLAQSLLGQEPKAFWYLARITGIVAYVLLWLTIVYGLLVSGKLVKLWNGGPMAVELHQFLTWLAMAFGLFHALILMGDKYIHSTLVQVLTPFAYTGYEPFWVGVGQVAFYLSLLVALSFYLRKQMGYRAWRMLHYVSFAAFVLLTAHGILAGTDTAQPAVLSMYVAASITVYFLLVVRVFSAVRAAKAVTHVTPKSTAHSPAAR